MPSNPAAREILAMICGTHGRIARRKNLLTGAGRFLLSHEDAEKLIDDMVSVVRSEWDATFAVPEPAKKTVRRSPARLFMMASSTTSKPETGFRLMKCSGAFPTFAYFTYGKVRLHPGGKRFPTFPAGISPAQPPVSSAPAPACTPARPRVRCWPGSSSCAHRCARIPGFRTCEWR